MPVFRRCPSYPNTESPALARKGSTTNRPKFRVLVVDDDGPMRRLIADLLSEHGYQCMTARNGMEALNQFTGKAVDAVITDIEMPQMDGITLSRILSSFCPNLPIMIITGNMGEDLPQLAIEADAWDFINKPFSINEFMLRFTRMMDYCRHSV